MFCETEEEKMLRTRAVLMSSMAVGKRGQRLDLAREIQNYLLERNGRRIAEDHENGREQLSPWQ